MSYLNVTFSPAASRLVDPLYALSLKQVAADNGYRKVECPSCWGSGVLELDLDTCRNCDGSGHLWLHRTGGTLSDTKLRYHIASSSKKNQR
jgi:RecJ-like exonuclease